MPSLNRETSLGVGLATAALVWGIYNSALPSIAESRVNAAGDRDLASAERVATWTSAAAVAGISLISKDPTVFVLGGAMTVALAWWHRHSNAMNPLTSDGHSPSSRQVNTELRDAAAGYTPAG
jgi:hypothetical protein